MERLRSRTLFHAGPDVTLVRAAKSRQPVQTADLRASRAYLDGDPLPVAAADIAGIRTLLSVPMLKEKGVVGIIAIYRKEVRPFTDKQIGLVSNFAKQAERDVSLKFDARLPVELPIVPEQTTGGILG
jgi:GAF domain-containing protein